MLDLTRLKCCQLSIYQGSIVSIHKAPGVSPPELVKSSRELNCEICHGHAMLGDFAGCCFVLYIFDHICVCISLSQGVHPHDPTDIHSYFTRVCVLLRCMMSPMQSYAYFILC